eukprot:gb/GECG01013940.1/.p1 GENE.gb/GECG01013940.1/~~gb/GECG01013940.1/.p1  ORF type:complete len:453 (+),score=36.09 gb/GECG01013940.1/:1-1359(+)
MVRLDRHDVIRDSIAGSLTSGGKNGTRGYGVYTRTVQVCVLYVIEGQRVPLHDTSCIFTNQHSRSGSQKVFPGFAGMSYSEVASSNDHILPSTKEKMASSKPYLRIDCHTHILPRSWPDWKEHFGYGGFIKLIHDEKDQGEKAKMYRDDGTFFREVKCNCWDGQTRIEDCQKVGVDVHVLSTVPVMFSYWAKPEDCLEVCKFLNNDMAEQVRANPKHFVGLGTLPMHAPDLAVQELERCVNELGLRGVEIGSHINDLTLDDPQLFPIFQKANDLGACIFVHPWDMIGKRLLKKYWLPWLVSMPAETSIAICSLIFGGVLEKLPDLRVMFAHCGGSFPGTVGRVQHGYDVRPDLCATDCSRPPKDFLGSFWVDSLAHGQDQLELARKVFSDDKIVLGSDYPFPLGEFTAESRGKEYAAGELVDSMDSWTEEQKKKVFQDNALNWLGLRREDFE